MRTPFLFAIFLFAGLSTVAQNKKRTESSLGSEVYPILPTYAQDLGLTMLTKSVHKAHYRFSTTGQMVEVWTDDGLSYQGFLLNYIYSVKRKERNIIFDKKDVTATSAKQIVALYDSLSLNRIPTDKKIANWQMGLDGGSGVIEFADSDSYSIKEYWEPDEQNQMPGLYIRQFFDRLNIMFQLRRNYILFERGLPIGKYNIGMLIMTKSVKFKRKGGSSLFPQ